MVQDVTKKIASALDVQFDAIEPPSGDTAAKKQAYPSVLECVLLSRYSLLSTMELLMCTVQGLGSVDGRDRRARVL